MLTFPSTAASVTRAVMVALGRRKVVGRDVRISPMEGETHVLIKPRLGLAYETLCGQVLFALTDWETDYSSVDHADCPDCLVEVAASELIRRGDP